MFKWNACIFLVAGLASPLLARELRDRSSEFMAAMEATFCLGDGTDSPQKFWNQGLHDAGMEIRTLDLKAGQQHSLNELATQAQKLARSNHHLSFAWSICKGNPGRAWILSAPAPAHWNTSTNPEEYCRESSWHFAHALRGVSTAIESAEIPSRIKSDNGMFSFTCLPKSPKWLGNQLWYLFPTENHGMHVPSEGSLMKQINRLRNQSALKQVELFTPDPKSLKGLERFTVNHDRRVLSELKQEFLAKHRLEFLGENRAVASSEARAAEMFWVSPTHRDLILDPKATHAVLRKKVDGNRTLYVLLLFKSNRDQNPDAASP